MSSVLPLGELIEWNICACVHAFTVCFSLRYSSRQTSSSLFRTRTHTHAHTCGATSRELRWPNFPCMNELLCAKCQRAFYYYDFLRAFRSCIFRGAILSIPNASPMVPIGRRRGWAVSRKTERKIGRLEREEDEDTQTKTLNRQIDIWCKCHCSTQSCGCKCDYWWHSKSCFTDNAYH